MRPTGLQAEHLAEALGLHTSRPRLSWRLPAGAAEQLAYEVEIDGVGTGRTATPGSVLNPWPGAPLGSRQRTRWRVRVWTDLGESEWSDPATIELGLRSPDDWSAQWIGPVEEARIPPGERPAYLLRGRFELADLGVGRLYATAHGIYECSLNGHRVGNHELAPGFTAYDRVLQVQTYDVSDLLVAGSNEWRVSLADGWFRGKNGFNQVADCYGTRVAFLGQLEVDGEVAAVTDERWEWAPSTTVAADLMQGQREDRRRLPSDWSPVDVTTHPLEPLTDSPAPPVAPSRRSVRSRSDDSTPTARSSTSARTSTAGSGSTTSARSTPRSPSSTAKRSTAVAM
ncbi:MAG: alpha-L-rhamnosidase N-terminal domain-containing protein [Acidimicrobiales bacterium]